MKPLVWISAGAAAAGLLLIARKASAKTPETPPATGFEPPEPPTPPPPQTYGETVRVPLAVPGGWRRVTNAEVNALPELRAAATVLRGASGFSSMPYGTLMPFVASDGNTYATWVEQHYHEPGGSVKPWGYHHGVTLLVKT